MREHRLRSIVKAASYRIVGSLGTVLIAFVFSGKLSIALSIGGTELVSKLVLYYVHERLWERISFGKGRVHDPEYSI